jgi:hypothetical protein
MVGRAVEIIKIFHNGYNLCINLRSIKSFEKVLFTNYFQNKTPFNLDQRERSPENIPYCLRDISSLPPVISLDRVIFGFFLSQPAKAESILLNSSTYNTYKAQLNNYPVKN